MKTADQKQIAMIAGLAATAFKDHRIEQRLDHGLYRNWRCSRPESSCYLFNVSTEPGRLFLTGDIGVLVVERTEDMLDWSPKSINDLHYFAEKVPREIATRQYSSDVATEALDELAREIENDEQREEIETLRLCVDDEHRFKIELYDSSLYDGDFPDLTVWKSGFLWQVEALRWFFGQLGLPRKEKKNGSEMGG